MKRDADIALRPTLHPPEHWIGRNLLPITYATYAHQDYVKVMQDLSSEKHRWVRLIDDFSHSPMSRMTVQLKANEAPVMITTGLMGVFDIVRSGLGIAALPCYLGESTPELVRIHEPVDEFNVDLWILAHPDIRRSAKVHAFFEFATARIRDDFSDLFNTESIAGQVMSGTFGAFLRILDQ